MTGYEARTADEIVIFVTCQILLHLLQGVTSK